MEGEGRTCTRTAWNHQEFLPGELKDVFVCVWARLSPNPWRFRDTFLDGQPNSPFVAHHVLCYVIISKFRERNFGRLREERSIVHTIKEFACVWGSLPPVFQAGFIVTPSRLCHLSRSLDQNKLSGSLLDDADATTDLRTWFFQPGRVVTRGGGVKGTYEQSLKQYTGSLNKIMKNSRYSNLKLGNYRGILQKKMAGEMKIGHWFDWNFFVKNVFLRRIFFNKLQRSKKIVRNIMVESHVIFSAWVWVRRWPQFFSIPTNFWKIEIFPKKKEIDECIRQMKVTFRLGTPKYVPRW